MSDARLKFLYTWNGTHVFSWKTRYSCPQITEISDGQKGGPESGDDPQTNLPPRVDEDMQTRPGTSLSPWSFGLAIVLFVLLSPIMFVNG